MGLKLHGFWVLSGQDETTMERDSMRNIWTEREDKGKGGSLCDWLLPSNAESFLFLLSFSFLLYFSLLFFLFSFLFSYFFIIIFFFVQEERNFFNLLFVLTTCFFSFLLLVSLQFTYPSF